MKDFFIRSVELSDGPKAMALMDLVGYKISLTDLERQYQAFISMDGYGAKVVFLGDEMVGMIAWSQATLFITGVTRFHIEMFVVTPEHRGKGLGQKLLSCIEAAAEEKRPSIIDVTAGIRYADEGTDEFYQTLSYNNQGPLKRMLLR